MKAKQLIIIAALLLAAIAPLSAQDFEKLNDSTWVRRYVYSYGTLSEYASPVDQSALLAKHNNDMRSAALLQGGCLASSALATFVAYKNATRYGGNNEFLNATATVLGIGAVAMGVASVFKLHQRKVYLTPEGIIVRINRTERPVVKQKGFFQ